jgi:hypothetical protein
LKRLLRKQWNDHPTDVDVSLRKFAKSKQIPLTTLQRQVKDKKPIAIDARPGRSALISTEGGEFVMDVLR